MARIEWENSLSIGVELIDEQHKMLIQRLSDLSKAIEMSRGEVEIVKNINTYRYNNIEYKGAIFTITIPINNN